MKILIVTDDYAYGFYFVQALRPHAIEAQLVLSADDAVRVISGSTFAAVLTDIVMPRRDGLELLREIRAARPVLPVIGMVESTNKKVLLTEEAFRALGGTALLRRPISIEDLASVLRALPAVP